VGSPARAQIYNKLITLADNVSISLCKGPRESVCVLRKTHADVGVALRKKEHRVVCKFLCIAMRVSVCLL
jgi:hypothetical protein